MCIKYTNASSFATFYEADILMRVSIFAIYNWTLLYTGVNYLHWFFQKTSLIVCFLMLGIPLAHGYIIFLTSPETKFSS